MKRVIVLSWFKTIKNRLFGEENEIVPEENKDEIEKERLPSHGKPVFRFPIITDAEIYGWDEDDENDKGNHKSELDNDTIVEMPSFSDEDEYEPIPLFENERWPGNDHQPIIHRAHTKKVEIEKITIDDAQTKKLETNKHFKNRFVPTTVPSPIYGFSNPEKKKGEEKYEIKTVLKDLVVPVTKTNVQEESFPKIESEDIKQQATILEQNNPNNSILEKEMDLFDENESFLEEASSPIEEIKEIAIVEEVSEINRVEEVDEENTKTVYNELPMPNENLPEVLEPMEEPAMEITPQEKKKEKIVPFNVLMLKSDKEKLAKLTQIVPIENKSAFIAQKLQNDPVENLHEEINKELQEELIEEPSEELDKEIAEEPSEYFSEEMVQETFIQEAIQKDLQVEEVTEVADEIENYIFPPTAFLLAPELQIEDEEWLESQSEKLEESLSHFGVQAIVIEALQGPTVTRFELTVGQGTKVSRVRNLTDDLKLALAAKEIRIQAPIPGTSSIGIEIPNRKTRPVRISEVIQTDEFMESSSPLEAVLGLGLTGKPVTIDLRKMPHGLIAGATGSGKSVCINSILVSLLYKSHPSDLKMMLIDPKMVELAPFNGIPHLISPVITDVKAATAALKWAVVEMDRRYELLAHAGVRDIERYNKVVLESKQHSLKMPYLLIVIDELADLMMMAPADVEISISRIAQKARACGIHLIIATQRPSVDVITGTIKANIPTRIAFSVSSQVDSRTIIDTGGAERLLGKGDMLYIGNGQSAPVRLQGTFVTDDEIERIIEHVQREASPQYLFGQDELLKSAAEEEEDPLFEQACLFIFEQGSASTSLLQRNFSIGYNRAAKLMDRLESREYISAQRGSRARDVLITESDLKQFSEASL